jgi:hypothetical protein
VASPGDASDALPADSERIPSAPIAHEATPAIATAWPADGAPSRREADHASREAEPIAEPAASVDSQPIASAPPIEAATKTPQPSAREKRPVVDLPPISSTLPPDSGLEIVETRFRPAPQPESDTAPAGPRRVRPPRITIADEPLQIVETRKDATPPPG